VTEDITGVHTNIFIIIVIFILGMNGPLDSKSMQQQCEYHSFTN